MRFCFSLLLLALPTIAIAKDATTTLRSVEVIADAGANQDSATALDLVFVYDRATLAQLPKSGPEWFEKKGALQNSLVDQLDVVSLQVPPGTALESAALPKRYRKALAVLAYLNYVAPGGQPMLSLTPFQRAVIRLHTTRVDVAEKHTSAHR